jgi:phosphomevalonate kinase
VYNIITGREKSSSKTASVRKEKNMNEDMNTSELLKEVTEENQTRKILEILNNCKDLEEAKEKVKALLKS